MSEDEGSSSGEEEPVVDSVAALSAFPVQASVRVQFPNAKASALAARVLEVDPELHAASVARAFDTDGDFLVVRVGAVDVRSLRLAMCGLLDMLSVCVRTLRDHST